MRACCKIVCLVCTGGSEGAAYIYRKFSSSGNSTSSVYWDLYLELQSVEGYSSYFGYSVDINDRMAVVGAVGYRDRVWDSRGEREYACLPACFLLHLLARLLAQLLQHRLKYILLL